MTGRLTHTFSERRLRSFAGIVFQAIALQARELADATNDFAGSSIAAIHSFALIDCRLSRNPIRLS